MKSINELSFMMFN